MLIINMNLTWKFDYILHFTAREILNWAPNSKTLAQATFFASENLKFLSSFPVMNLNSKSL